MDCIFDYKNAKFTDPVNRLVKNFLRWCSYVGRAFDLHAKSMGSINVVVKKNVLNISRRKAMKSYDRARDLIILC